MNVGMFWTWKFQRPAAHTKAILLGRTGTLHS